MALDVENYFSRISFQGEPKINLGTLAKLHRKHVQTIPFENLDIHYGRRISLAPKKIEEKIISNRRGGFCYELNGLFCALLKQLGFDVKMISARVNGKEKFGQEFDHMVLTVNLGEEWLVDVGFGDSFLEPIRMQVGEIQQDQAGFFRIEEHDSIYRKMELSKDGLLFSPKYIFTQIERQLEDFEEMCEYHQTSPESTFTRERVCTMAIEDGRITLRDQNLIETIKNQRTVTEVMDEDEYDKILKDRFGIEIR